MSATARQHRLLQLGVAVETRLRLEETGTRLAFDSVSFVEAASLCYRSVIGAIFSQRSPISVHTDCLCFIATNSSTALDGPLQSFASFAARIFFIPRCDLQCSKCVIYVGLENDVNRQCFVVVLVGCRTDSLTPPFYLVYLPTRNGFGVHGSSNFFGWFTDFMHFLPCIWLLLLLIQCTAQQTNRTWE